MLHCSSQFAVLDQQAELISSYIDLQPLPRQFNVSRPFPAQQSAATVGSKRKRSAEPADAEEATGVHDQLASRLQSALAGFQAWLQNPDQLQQSPAKAQPATTAEAQPASGPSEALQTAAAPAAAAHVPALDCVLLASLMQALKPKLSWLSPAREPGNLFNTLHSNAASEEALVLAHETPAVLPRRSAFMLGDLKNIKTLVKGELTSHVCLERLAMHACRSMSLQLMYTAGLQYAEPPGMAHKDVTPGPVACADNAACVLQLCQPPSTAWSSIRPGRMQAHGAKEATAACLLATCWAYLCRPYLLRYASAVSSVAARLQHCKCKALRKLQ